MSSKHLFDSAEGLVVKSLRGAVALNPSLRLHAPSKSVFDVNAGSSKKVLVISGGGAGHEPAHAGYTAKGMLAASVSGEIFASPSARQIATCIDLVVSTLKDGCPKEALFVVNNYTGDRSNFGLAAEKARAKGIDVRIVVNADDVAIGRSKGGLVGRRGLAGNIIVCKILGAAAERGLTLDGLQSLGETVTQNLASIAVSLDHCHVPGRNKDPTSWEKLDEEACELGMGLHNEPGARRLNSRPEPEELVSHMLDFVLGEDEDRNFVPFSENDEVALFMNNQGGLSQLEMSAIVDETLSQLESRSLSSLRVYASSYMTSLNAPGFSISLLNISNINRAASLSKLSIRMDILRYLDDPTEAVAWIGAKGTWPSIRRDRHKEEIEIEHLVHSFPKSHLAQTKPSTNGVVNGTHSDNKDTLKAAIRGACEGVLAAEADMTKFDTVMGDGDCGESFAKGAKEILSALEHGEVDLSTPFTTVSSIAGVIEHTMGGTSGAIIALYLASLSSSLKSGSWTSSPLTALQSLNASTPAREGDRTMIDALSPFCDTLSSTKDLTKSVAAAREGAERTRTMKARLGRAVYVGETESKGEDQGIPDPGAWGVAALLAGLEGGLRKARAQKP